MVRLVLALETHITSTVYSQPYPFIITYLMYHAYCSSIAIIRLNTIQFENGTLNSILLQTNSFGPKCFYNALGLWLFT